MRAEQFAFDRLGTSVASPADVSDGLRWYQEDAVAAATNALEAAQKSSILKMPTGSGKTRTGIALCRRWLRGNGDNALWLANRTFLTEDALERLWKTLKIHVDLEKARWTASESRMTVGSAQTFVGKRLKAMPRDRYGLIIVDEVQYIDSPGGRAIVEHFDRAQWVGLSATPGDAFGGRSSHVYSKDILWAMREGYFVPIVPRYERVVELDISDVRTVDGDLQVSALEKKVAAAAIPIAKIAWQQCGARPTIIYTPGVASAHAVCRWLNEQRPGCAQSVDAKTPPAVRRKVLEDFDRGLIQYIANCGVFLYGLDVPRCAAIVIARMTEDRDLWEQMIGRGGRPAPGIGELPETTQRLESIAASAKPDMLLLILSGEHGKHSLCDVGDLDEEAPKTQRDAAKRDAQKSPGKSVEDVLRDAKAWQKKENDRVLRAMEAAKLKTEGGKFDPFARGKKTKRDPMAPHWTKDPATSGQRYWNRAHGLSDDMTKGEAAMWRGRYETWLKNGRVGDWKRDRVVGEDDGE